MKFYQKNSINCVYALCAVDAQCDTSTIYVGVSYQPEERCLKGYKKNLSVEEEILSTEYTLTILESNLARADALTREAVYIHEYQSAGYHVLNKNKTAKESD